MKPTKLPALGRRGWSVLDNDSIFHLRDEHQADILPHRTACGLDMTGILSFSSNGGIRFAEADQMATSENPQYRGYDIIPTRQWGSWCVGVYPTRDDLPLLPRSTLGILASQRAEAIAEAKKTIDHLLSRRGWRRGGG